MIGNVSTDEAYCTVLQMNYCALFDRCDFDKWLQLFIPECSWILKGRFEIHGRQNLARFIGQRPGGIATLHAPFELWVKSRGNDTAEGIGKYVVFRSENGKSVSALDNLSHAIVDFRDTYKKSDCAWQIESRVMTETVRSQYR